MARDTRLDPAQIAKYKFDETIDADRVTMVNTEIAIELDANDGDSVEIRAMEVRATPALGADVDVSKMRRVAVWVEGGAGSYTVTAKVGTATLTLGTVATGTGGVFEVLADTVNVTGTAGATVTVIGRGI